MKDKIFALHAEGKTYSQIKEELGCSKGTISYYLGENQREKTVQRTRNARTKIQTHIQETKQSTPCTDCRENYPYWMMEFDHLGNKDFAIARYRNHTNSIDRVKEEIAKCEVVCANCHKNRTFQRSLTTSNATMDVSDHY